MMDVIYFHGLATGVRMILAKAQSSKEHLLFLCDLGVLCARNPRPMFGSKLWWRWHTEAQVRPSERLNFSRAKDAKAAKEPLLAPRLRIPASSC
jgi:hypothetical protein